MKAAPAGRGASCAAAATWARPARLFPDAMAGGRRCRFLFRKILFRERFAERVLSR
jgi:hypothetical protein